MTTAEKAREARHAFVAKRVMAEKPTKASHDSYWAWVKQEAAKNGK